MASIKSNIYKKKSTFFMVFLQRLADQQQWYLCLKMDRLDVLQKQSYIRDERLDILETFKEHHQALPEVVRDSLCHSRLAAATASLLWINKMVNNRDVPEEQLQGKIREKNKDTALIVTTRHTPLFKATTKMSWSPFLESPGNLTGPRSYF